MKSDRRMEIDLERCRQKMPGLDYEVMAEAHLPDLGVDVAWVRWFGDDYESSFLHTSEDPAREVAGVSWEREREVQRRAHDLWMGRARERNAARWSAMDLPDALYDIASRVWSGEWLGQSADGVIYLQEAGHLLGLGGPDSAPVDPRLWEAAQTLQAAEKADLSGMILLPYRPGFRFPEQIRHMIRYLVEEPLGWPNGDAGDLAVYKLESAVDDSGAYAHGRELVGTEGFPHLAPRHLVSFGLEWLTEGIQKGTELGPVEREALADKLAPLVEQLRSS